MTVQLACSEFGRRAFPVVESRGEQPRARVLSPGRHRFSADRTPLMTPLDPLRRPRTLIALPVLLVLVLIVTAGAAVSPDTARAGAYDFRLAPPTKCGGSRQTDTSLPTSDQEKVMQCLHNWARQGRVGARCTRAVCCTGRRTGRPPTCSAARISAITRAGDRSTTTCDG